MSDSQNNNSDKNTHHFINHFFSESVTCANLYTLDVDTSDPCSIRLHQNESYLDWPQQLKKQICDQLLKINWNNYPKPFPIHQENLLAKFHNLQDGSVLLGRGASYLIELLLGWLGQDKSHTWYIPNPSFSLFKMRAKMHKLNFKLWDLAPDLSYDLISLKNLPAKSIVIFDTPNNPAGSVINYHQLDDLLSYNKDVVFICDAAYNHFSNIDYCPLINKHDNLIIIHTLSKAGNSAALRIGYIISNPPTIDLLRKLTLPYSIGPLGLLAVDYSLSQVFIDHQKSIIDKIICARDFVFKDLKMLSEKSQKSEISFNCYPSLANYLLLTFKTIQSRNNLNQFLYHQAKILVRKMPKAANMNHGLRISIGSPSDNQLLIKTIDKWVCQNL